MTDNYSKISYIYGLSSSDREEIIRYIGYSNNPKRRLGEHIERSKKDKTKVYCWIKSHIEKGHKINIHILSCYNESKIGIKETETILLYKSAGANLLNHNNGGLGGISPDAETRRKISEFHKGNTWNRFKVKKPKVIKEKLPKVFHPAPNRILTEEKVLKLYKLHSEGKTPAEIMRLENITRTQMNNLFYHPKRYSDIKLKHNLVLTKQQAGVKKK